jgi:hypothetical protein
MKTVNLTRFIIPSKEQWKSWTLPSKAGYLGYVAGVLGILLFFLQLIFLNSNISISLDNSFPSKNHFDKPFFIKNDSPYRIHDIHISAETIYMYDPKYNNSFNNNTFEIKSIDKLEKNASQSIRVPFANYIIMPQFDIKDYPGIEISIVVKYRIPYALLNIKKKSIFSYTVTIDGEGGTHWEPISIN